MSMEAPAGPFKDGFVSIAGLICLLGLGGFVVWGAFIPLADGVAGAGHISGDSTQEVQHLEGGIISDIRVREGDRVEAGEVLLVLSETPADVERQQVLNQIATLTGQVARLNALLDEAEQPDFTPVEALEEVPADVRGEVISRERRLFNDQREGFLAQISLLETRRDGAIRRQELLTGQIRSARNALASSQRELSEARNLFDQQMRTLEQVRALEQEVADRQTEIGRLETERNDAQIQEQDNERQISQYRAQFIEERQGELSEAEAELRSARQALRGASDVVERSEVRAPTSGVVLNLEANTIGGVIQRGETIMEIVPDVGEITSIVRIAPQDRNAVEPGQRVRVMVLSRSWRNPRVEGEVISLSADQKTDEQTGTPYFEARVQIPADEMARAAAEIGRSEEFADVRGLPVQVFIFSGANRTMFARLFEPIGESLFRGVRGS